MLIITTGGTIDKTYARGAGTRDLTNEGTQVLSILSQARSHPYETLDLLAKDSLDMTETDRALIVEACCQAKEDRLVVVHGTDTMTRTAAALSGTTALRGKTIVMTGSSQPWCLKNSDADFNLGLAIGAAQCAAPGVYVAMNGAVFREGTCRKNPETGMFEAVVPE